MATRNELEASRANAVKQLSEICVKERMTQQDRDDVDRLGGVIDETNRLLAGTKDDTRSTNSAVPEIQGEPGEMLRADQSMSEWLRRASENKAYDVREDNSRSYYSYASEDQMHEQINRRIANQSGLESRALTDTTGSAAVNQTWQAKYIDFLYAQTLLGRAGMTKFAMVSAVQNVPQLASPVAPQWIAEGSPVGIDATPALSGPLVFDASAGGFKDIQLFSREFVQDALLQDGVAGMLMQSASRAYAIGVDQSGLYGVAANATKMPGLFAETGIINRSYTGDSGSGEAPSDYTEISKVAEIIENTNVSIDDPAENVAILSNPSVRYTFDRLQASTYAKWFEPSPKTANLVNNRWFTSTTLTDTETDNYNSGTADEPAATGGALSSLVIGPFSRLVMGVRLDTESFQLDQRYIDLGMVGIWLMGRWCIRATHPETFVRTGGIVTS
jgi:Phage capsid family